MFKKYLCNFYDILELYKIYAEARGFSPKTIRSTETNLKTLGKFICLKKPIRKFNESQYEEFLIKLRTSQYSEETKYDLNATLRKLINFALRRGFINKNPLTKSLNFSLAPKPYYRLISASEFSRLKKYFQTHGKNDYEFLILILYYTGIRIGEALALTTTDFQASQGRTIHINKSYLYDFKLLKSPKNKKCRDVPLPKEVCEKFKELPVTTGRIFHVSPSAVNAALKVASLDLGIAQVHCHLFRHTYISNLIRAGVPLPVIANVSGDTQKTILTRYSHMVASDRKLVLKALKKV